MPNQQLGAPRPMTNSELAAMSVQARQSYFTSLPPQQQQDARAAWDSSRMSMNREYMKRTIRHLAIAPQASGGAITQPFANGQMLSYLVQTANNAFLECIRIRAALTISLAAGTSALYNVNAAAPLNVLDSIQLLYNGTQMNIRPFIRDALEKLTGYLQTGVPKVPVATANIYADSFIDNYINSAGPTATLGSATWPHAVGANTWNFEFRIPLNALHPQDARGLLPMMAPGTDVLINLNCCGAPQGPDPILNVTSVLSGTGQANTITGTFQVIAEYRDGKTLQGPILQGLDILDMGTVQYVRDNNLNNLLGGIIQRQKIAQVNHLFYVLSVIVDGNQSTSFALTSNIQVLELDMDGVGTNMFWKLGTGTNIDVREFWVDLIDDIGSDFQEGIIPWVRAPIMNTADSSNLDGTAFLNTTPSGWTDVHYGVQLATTSAAGGINPRVETFIVMVNTAGLVAA